jgi:hypothetical protein
MDCASASQIVAIRTSPFAKGAICQVSNPARLFVGGGANRCSGWMTSEIA